MTLLVPPHHTSNFLTTKLNTGMRHTPLAPSNPTSTLLPPCLAHHSRRGTSQLSTPRTLGVTRVASTLAPTTEEPDQWLLDAPTVTPEPATSAYAPYSEYRPLDRMCASQVVEALTSVATYGHQPSPVWLTQCSNLTSYRLSDLTPVQLASVVSSFVELRYDPGEDWMMDFDLACFSHPGPFDPDSTTTILSALLQRPGPYYRFPMFVYHKVSNQVNEFDYHQLSSILRALTPLGVDMDDQFLHHVGVRMAELMLDMDAQQLRQQGLGLPDGA